MVGHSDDELKGTVGARIRQRRLELGYSQKQLAEEAGIRGSSLCKLEAGRTWIGHEDLVRVAEILDTSLDYLFGRDRSVHEMPEWLRQYSREREEEGRPMPHNLIAAVADLEREGLKVSRQECEALERGHLVFTRFEKGPETRTIEQWRDLFRMWRDLDVG